MDFSPMDCSPYPRASMVKPPGGGLNDSVPEPNIGNPAHRLRAEFSKHTAASAAAVAAATSAAPFAASRQPLSGTSCASSSMPAADGLAGQKWDSSGTSVPPSRADVPIPFAATVNPGTTTESFNAPSSPTPPVPEKPAPWVAPASPAAQYRAAESPSQQLGGSPSGKFQKESAPQSGASQPQWKQPLSGSEAYPTFQPSATQSEPAPAFSATFTAKLNMNLGSDSPARGFSFSAAAERQRTPQRSSHRVSSARSAQSSAHSKPAAAARPTQPANTAPQAVPAASTQWFPPQPTSNPQPAPAFTSFAANSTAAAFPAAPASFVFGKIPTASSVPPPSAPASQPARKPASEQVPGDFSFSQGAGAPTTFVMAAGSGPVAGQGRTPRRAVPGSYRLRSRPSPPSRVAGGLQRGIGGMNPKGLFQQPGADSVAPRSENTRGFSPLADGMQSSPPGGWSARSGVRSEMPPPPVMDPRIELLRTLDARAKTAFGQRSYGAAEMGYSQARALHIGC